MERWNIVKINFEKENLYDYKHWFFFGSWLSWNHPSAPQVVNLELELADIGGDETVQHALQYNKKMEKNITINTENISRLE